MGNVLVVSDGAFWIIRLGDGNDRWVGWVRDSCFCNFFADICWGGMLSVDGAKGLEFAVCGRSIHFRLVCDDCM